MKKLNSNPYQRNLQTQQQERTTRVDRVERVERLRQNLKLNQYGSNTQNYRKHNSPDANRLRNYQNQNQVFASKNYKGQKVQEQNIINQDYNKSQAQNPPASQKSGQYRQLQKTTSSPKLVQQNKQEGYENEPKNKQQLYTQTDQYQKLHQKLNSIEDKIVSMKRNIQRKREQKQKMLQKQRVLQKQKREKLQEQKRAQSQQKTKKNPLKGLVTQVPEHKQLHTFDGNPYSPTHNVYYVSQIVRAYLDEKSLAREHILTSLHILRILERTALPNDEQIKRRSINMPIKKGKQNRKCVVFDLDETLIHCNDSLTPSHDVKLPIKFPTGQIIQAGINIRPYARQILRNLSNNFQVIVFTASHSCYANVVLDYLDPTGQYIDYRLYREHCFQTPQGMYVKDLSVLGRDLKNVALVDNAAYSYAFQLDNGIPILPYYHGSQDFELKALQKFLQGYLLVNDVRTLNRKTFGLTKYKNYYKQPERLVEQLYMDQQIQQNQKNYT